MPDLIPSRPMLRGLWLALALLSPGAPAGEGERLLEAVLAEVQAARGTAGAARLERRAALDAAARRRAREVAARPEGERLRLSTSIEETLRDSGIRGYHRAGTHLDLQRRTRHQGDGVEVASPLGDVERAAAGVLDRWRGYGTAWREALDPGMNAVGLGLAESGDGWLVMVAILLEDQDLPEDLAEIEAQVLRALNRRREERGLSALEHDPRLAQLARGHSRDMAARGYFDHLSPEGESVSDRARRAGILYRRIAENIAFNERAKRPGQTAAEGWMDSRSHRANILDGAYTHTGVGVAVNAEGALYFTQVFLLSP